MGDAAPCGHVKLVDHFDKLKALAMCGFMYKHDNNKKNIGVHMLDNDVFAVRLFLLSKSGLEES